jgi:Zn finger protein HypA/HybF involved in hydrogenase expression
MDEETFRCDTCETVVAREEVVRSETMGDLDPEKWQTVCCPTCGGRLKTVFVGDE